MDMLQTIWGGNSVLRWMIAAAIALAIPVIVRVLLAMVGRPAAASDAGRRPSMRAAIGAPLACLLWFAGLWLILHEVLISPVWLRVWSDRLIYFGFMLGCGWLLARVVERAVDGYFIRGAEAEEPQVNGLLHPLFRWLSRLVVWSAVLVLGLDNMGFEIGAILAGLGIGGLALAMAAKDLLTDILGGIYIMMNRPFKVGDKLLYKGE